MLSQQKWVFDLRYVRTCRLTRLEQLFDDTSIVEHRTRSVKQYLSHVKIYWSYEQIFCFQHYKYLSNGDILNTMQSKCIRHWNTFLQLWMDQRYLHHRSDKWENYHIFLPVCIKSYISLVYPCGFNQLTIKYVIQIYIIICANKAVLLSFLRELKGMKMHQFWFDLIFVNFIDAIFLL